MKIATTQPNMANMLLGSDLFVDDIMLPEQVVSGRNLTPEALLVFAVVLSAYDDARRDKENAREWWRDGDIGRITADVACAMLAFNRTAIVERLERMWATIDAGTVPYTRIRNVTRGRGLGVGTAANRYRDRRGMV